MTSTSPISGATRLFVTSTVARLPLACLGIGLLAHAAHLTGSFASAGLVAGAYAIATGVGGPLAGRLVDRRGQTLVLCGTAAATAVLLAVAALLSAGTPLAVLLALAAGIGLVTPPVGSCVRAALPGVIDDPSAVRSAFAVEAAVAEVTWVAGPPFTLGLGALFSTAVALAASGVVILAATLAFAALPASRTWRPVAEREPGGAMASAGMRTLVAVLLFVGVLFGALEVAATAAVGSADSATSAAPFLALWGLGSLIGGIVLARRGGRGASASLLVVLLGILSLGHLLLVPVAGGAAPFAGMLLVAGAAIAPTLAVAFGLVDELAPSGSVTEAFAWLATAEAVGSALGSALAGSIVTGAGPVPALVFAAAAGAAAMLTALAGRTTLTGAGTSFAPEIACAGQAV
jgi:predicted MFS family arabinose efflux permease